MFDSRVAVRQRRRRVRHMTAALFPGPPYRTRHRDQEDDPVGQKTVRFSDLSGQLITDDAAPARIVVQEHPGLQDGPVEIEALAAEATDIEKAGGQAALVDLYLPGDQQPRRVVLDAAEFDRLATDKPMSEILAAARPARPARRSSRSAAARDQASAAQDRAPAAQDRAPAAQDQPAAVTRGPAAAARAQGSVAAQEQAATAAERATDAA
jgi:hypothetical protein